MNSRTYILVSSWIALNVCDCVLHVRLSVRHSIFLIMRCTLWVQKKLLIESLQRFRRECSFSRSNNTTCKLLETGLEL